MRKRKSESLDGKAPIGPSSGSRQGTIGQAFAKASANSVQLPLLEVSEARGFAINNYDSQNIRNTLDHHLSELKRKRLSIPAVDEGFVQGRANRRLRSNLSEEQPEGRQDNESQLLEQDAKMGDEDAYRFLCQLQELTSSQTIPTREQLASVIGIMRGHGLHGRRDLSSLAYRLLQQVANFHPSVSVQQSQGEITTPYVLVNTNAWCLTGSCDGFAVDQFNDQPLERRILPFQILNHLVTLAHAAVIPSSNGKPPARSAALTSGDLFFFKWVVSELQRDLSRRLEVYFSFPAESFPQHKKTLPERKSALLQNSQLWRIFSDSAVKTYDCDRKSLIQKLMEIIAAPADEGNLEPSSLEQLAFNAVELSEIAAQLLRLLLELYGTAEDAKMFLKYAINRASTSGILDNVRMVIETAMVDGFVGSNNVLRTLPQKRAFLLALPNKDRMRLLNMVVAIKHARRKHDGAKYPNLEVFNQLYVCPGEAEAYLQAEPAEALQYILDDFLLAFNLVDKTADGLALLVSSLCQAAADELPSEKLKTVSRCVEEISEAFDRQTAPNKSLTAVGLVSMQAARHAISTCS